MYENLLYIQFLAVLCKLILYFLVISFVADLILQAIRIGDVAIASIPCEVFAEIGLDIKDRSPLKTTFTIELANGWNRYLPTPRQHRLGGYETWLGTNMLEIRASEKIEHVILDLLRDVSGAEPGRQRATK